MSQTQMYKPDHVSDVETIGDRDHESKALLAEGLRMILAIQEGKILTGNMMIEIDAGHTFYITEKLKAQIKAKKCRDMLKVLRPETETGNKTEKR